MTNFITCFAKYKKDIFYVLALLFLFVFFAIISGCVYGSIYTDSAREAYLPEMILQGKVIYKDIFALFLPLSYWFNAGLYYLFGTSFKVLYLYSYVNAYIILFGIYLICRVFLKEYLSAVITLVIMCFYVLSNPFTIMSYIFPYAYAMIYACAWFTYSVLFFLYYMKTDNKKLLYTSFLMLGVCYANKPEFLFSSLLMLLVMFSKHEKLKTFILGILTVLLPPFLCILVLFFQGFDFKHLYDYLLFSFSFFNVYEEFEFILFGRGYYPPKQIVFDTLYTLTLFAVSYVYISMFFKNKYYKIFAILSAPAYLLFLAGAININLLKGYMINFFFFTFPVLIIILKLKAKKLDTLKDKMLFFISIAGILSMYRILFFPFKVSYAVYYILPVLAFFLYFFLYAEKKAVTAKIVSIVLIILSVTYIPPYRYLRDILEVFEFKSPKGNITSLYFKAESFGFLVDFINKNAQKDDTVLVLPEGTLLNHITGTKTNPKFYQLTPNHISAIGEENIVRELKENPPEFIVLTDERQVAYGKDLICESFAYKICGFIYGEYTKVAEFDVELKVYKHNDKKLD